MLLFMKTAYRLDKKAPHKLQGTVTAVTAGNLTFADTYASWRLR